MAFWIGVVGLCFGLGAWGCGEPVPSSEEADTQTKVEQVPELQRFGSIGGDFTLTDHNGMPFRLSAHKDKVVLLFFGFTFCPDVCPTTMARVAQAYQQLGEGAEQLMTVFVSVDPQRDTPAVLAEYLEYFDVGAVGLTGTEAQVRQVAQQYSTHFEVKQTDSAGGYTIDHSTYTFLIDQEGTIRYLFRLGDKPAVMAAVIRQLLKG